MPWDRKGLLGHVETIQLMLGVTDKKIYKCLTSIGAIVFVHFLCYDRIVADFQGKCPLKWMVPFSTCWLNVSPKQSGTGTKLVWKFKGRFGDNEW